MLLLLNAPLSIRVKPSGNTTVFTEESRYDIATAFTGFPLYVGLIKRVPFSTPLTDTAT